VTFFLLLLAAFLGGGANALAGGGQFIVFPALLLGGVASVKANATASLVMVPGAIVSTWVYRRTVSELSGRLLTRLLIASLAGSAAGSVLLLSTTNGLFSDLVPWLLLVAAIVFSLAPRLRAAAVKPAGHNSVAWLLAGQFAISVYGGYFGAGMGILMVALFLVTTTMNLQAATGIRLICATSVNILAVILFAWRGALDWQVGLPMLAAGTAGGYLSARAVRRLNENVVRNAVLVYAWGLTAYFFARLLWRA
jgi:uncharacterized membrane protein YfcA